MGGRFTGSQMIPLPRLTIPSGSTAAFFRPMYGQYRPRRGLCGAGSCSREADKSRTRCSRCSVVALSTKIFRPRGRRRSFLYRNAAYRLILLRGPEAPRRASRNDRSRPLSACGCVTKLPKYPWRPRAAALAGRRGRAQRNAVIPWLHTPAKGPARALGALVLAYIRDARARPRAPCRKPRRTNISPPLRRRLRVRAMLSTANRSPGTGFSRALTANSLDAVSDRDFAIEFVGTCRF